MFSRPQAFDGTAREEWFENHDLGASPRFPRASTRSTNYGPVCSHREASLTTGTTGDVAKMQSTFGIPTQRRWQSSAPSVHSTCPIRRDFRDGPTQRA
ncbi:hypothetical protein C8039_13565 [Halogeometricum sp. wsp3]|nr:hypothetical protein C8039_13565 [Halogeometricum sp. wsp3]